MRQWRMKKDISEIMRDLNNRQPLWKKQLNNYKTRQIQDVKRKQRSEATTKVKAVTNEKTKG
jgi:hypothetical protein